ncbi:FadR/GntR family transcriptional regulator [Pseudoduganella sp. LjRoot289]|uniref:FadR/GntR family transcriptional regulator n=1 Tax=Pseudoduganella sp. LjRoot289 TaxID=3342314 RepID=UPI003ECE4D57
MENSFQTGTLGARVAEQLLSKIRAEGLAPGTRLPSEQAMAQHFGVSRTVVRDAIGLLKADGLLETRKGSGAFVCQADAAPAFRSDSMRAQSIQSLLNIIEVREGMEAEIAALAAVRRTPGQLADIEHALRKLEEAVAAGSDGVEEDANFHQCIAMATGNPAWVRLVDMFAEPIRSAVKVTRANEARREDFTRQVQDEHEQLLAAIAARDPEQARAAAKSHMEHAAKRVREADREFWRGKGGELARSLSEQSADWTS